METFNMTKQPLPGRWLLLYDEESLIFKEVFLLEPKSDIPDERMKEYPKSRITKCCSWDIFKEMKNTFDVPVEDQIPACLYPNINCYRKL